MRTPLAAVFVVSCHAMLTDVDKATWVPGASKILEQPDENLLHFIQVDMQVHVDVNHTARQTVPHHQEENVPQPASVPGKVSHLSSRSVMDGPDVHKAVELGVYLAKRSFYSFVGDEQDFEPPANAADAAGGKHAIARFVSHCIGATVLVLLMCGDDLCWLLPFCVGPNKYRMALFYIFCMIFMWWLCCCMFAIARAVQATHQDLPIEEITDVASTLLLVGLTTKFYFEWQEEEEEEEEEESTNIESDDNAAENEDVQNTDNGIKSSLPAAGFKEDKAEASASSRVRNQKLGYWRLFLVSLGGNLDNLGVCTPILLAQVFSPWELLVGDFTAAIIIAGITLGLSQFQVLTNMLTQVPLWMIVGTLTVFVGCNTVYTFAH